VALARAAVRGALWTIATGVGSRGVGLVGTLVLTRFIAPDAYGEVMVASVVVQTANQITTIGFGQYLVANPDAPRSMAFHVTAMHVALGLLSAAGVLAFAGLLGPALDAPHMAVFLPGLVLSGVLDRVAYVPERVLVRELRFGTVSFGRTVGELAYTFTCLGFAVAGAGGAAIVLGNVVRSLLRGLAFVLTVKARDWLEPCRPSWRATRELLAFGVPMSLSALFAFAARRWDNLAVSRFFGARITGLYNLAYNLADVPAIQVGEQIGDVLLPSFARMPADRRPAALVRSMRLLGLVVFPLAVGLGAVAPTLVAVAFDARWQLLAPMLVLLSALSVTRPVGWTVESYLQARQLPRAILGLEAFKAGALLLFLFSFGRLSPLWTCAAVGVAFAAHAMAALWVLRVVDGLPLRRTIGTILPPLGACVVMALAVVAVRHGLNAATRGIALEPVVRLVVEIAVGGFTYVTAALVLAQADCRDLMVQLRGAVRSHA